MFIYRLSPYRKAFPTSLLFISQMLISTIAHALPVSSFDLWEGAAITGSSGVLITSDERNMFGGTFGTLPTENADTLFRDDEPYHFTHWVEWMTSSAITLGSFNLVAAHDEAPRDIGYRGFDEFRLYTGNGSGDWTRIYDHITVPDSNNLYGGGPYYSATNMLELTALVSPVTSQYFRAEFVQSAGPGTLVLAAGPRIVELDGYAVPEPSTVVLLFSGLLFFQRRINAAKAKQL